MHNLWDHDDVIKWKHFPGYWPFVRGIHRSPVNSPHKGQWRGALMFHFICAWTNGWVNNRDAGDLTFHRAHYDVTVMIHWISVGEYRKINALWSLKESHTILKSASEAWRHHEILRILESFHYGLTGIMVSVEDLCPKPHPTDVLYCSHLSWLLNFHNVYLSSSRLAWLPTANIAGF